jgi:hypothetical protein
VLPLFFTIWLYGTTGSLKSTLTALALRHFGKFAFNTPPASWTATANALEKLAITIERLRVWLDDCALPAYNLNQSIRTSDEAHWTTPTAELRLIASTHDRVTL